MILSNVLFHSQEILELVPEEVGGFRAETVASYDVGDVIMCSALCPIKDSRHLFLAAGKVQNSASTDIREETNTSQFNELP